MLSGSLLAPNHSTCVVPLGRAAVASYGSSSRVLGQNLARASHRSTNAASIHERAERDANRLASCGGPVRVDSTAIVMSFASPPASALGSTKLFAATRTLVRDVVDVGMTAHARSSERPCSFARACLLLAVDAITPQPYERHGFSTIKPRSSSVQPGYACSYDALISSRNTNGPRFVRW